MTEATPEKLICLARELLESWHGKQDLTSKATAAPSRSAAQYPIIHGLVAHAHRAAEAALVLTEQEMAFEAVPLVRMTYECAITATWISQVDDAIAAFGNEDLRMHRHFEDNAAEAGVDLGADWQDSTAAQAQEFKTSSKLSARRFDQRCEDLGQAGTGAYLLYRILSAHSHPTVACAAQYIDPPKSEEGPPVLGFEPRRGADTLELTLLVGSLVWAGRAVEYKEQGKPARRALLRRVAKEAGVAADLELSASAHLRLAMARREQKEHDRAARQTRAAAKKAATHETTPHG